MGRKTPKQGQLESSLRGVVLAVDTATRSGWAIRFGHRLMWSGESDTLDPDALDTVCDIATEYARQTNTRPPVLVLERPWGGLMHTVMALGMARERWLAAWVRAGMSRRRVVSVRPATWRAPVLGGASIRMKREQVREREMLSARAEVGFIDIGPDEAAAVCMSRWAVRAPAVGELFGIKRKVAS